MRRVAFAMLSLALAFGAVVGAGPTQSAVAAEPDLLVSDDGVLFTPLLGAPLFRDAEPLVPLESDAASLWVRNSSDAAAELRISVAQIATSSLEMASSVTLATTDAARGTRAEADLSQIRRCDVLVPSRRVAAGATVRIDFDVAMLDVGGQTAQAELGSLALTAAMRDASAGPLPNAVCDGAGVEVPVWEESTSLSVPSLVTSTGSERLGTTGSTPAPWLAAAGAALALGMLLFAAGRRRRSERS